MSRVVITGIGVVSPAGNCKECFWNGIMNGPAPFRPVVRFPTDPVAELRAAEVSGFESAEPAKPKQVWASNRSIQFALAASRQALAEAGIVIDESNRAEIGVVFGSTQSCLDIAVKVDTDGITRGPRTVNPMLFPHSNPSAPSCRVSLELGLQGFNTILSNGPGAGLDAIQYATGAIRDGLAPVVLAGGVEELTRMTFLFHHAMESRALDTAAIVPGEGCGVLVLETENHARNRGASLLAEVAGYGTCFWPGERFAGERVNAQVSAMRSALETSGLRPRDVDVVFSSTNGDETGDRIEAEALHKLFPGVPVSALKHRLGETHSAAGALHSAACVLALSAGVIPSVDGPVSRPVRAALINCFSTSRSTQTNTSLVLKTVDGIRN